MAIRFLNPSALWALPLAAVPLLLYLLFRRKPPLLPFASISIIRQSQALVARHIKLRQVLVIVLRTLAVILLIAALARPFAQYAGMAPATGRADAGRAMVILLDASYSMGYYDDSAPRFTRMQERARQLLAAAGPDVRAGVVVFSDRIEAATPRLSSDRAYLEQLIDRAQLTFRPTDIAAAWPAVEQLLAQAPAADPAVIVLSDLAAHGVRQQRVSPSLRGTVMYFPAAAGENTWIESAAGTYDADQQSWRLEARLRSMAGRTEPLPVYWQENGRKIGEGLARLRPDEPHTERFSYPADTPALAAAAQLAPDRLAADNVRYFTVEKPETWPVWIVDGDPQFGGVSAESYYLRHAFPEAALVTEEELPGMQLHVPGLLILANTRASFPAAERFARAGGGVMVFLGNNDPGDGAAFLPAEIGAHFAERNTVAWAAQSHPLRARLSLDEFDWSKTLVAEGYVVRPRPGAQTLAVLSSGWPLLVTGTAGAGRTVLVTSTADRAWNNLVNRPFFVPLFRALARDCANAPDARQPDLLNIGDPYTVSSLAAPAVRTPSGKMAAVRAAGNAVFTETDEPGIYTVYAAGRPVRSFAVNLPADVGESDLRPAPPGALKTFFSGAAVIPLRVDGWEKSFKAALYGTALARYCLAGAILLLLLETVIAHAWRVRPSPAKPVRSTL